MPILRKTLRDLRWQIIGYGVGLGVLAAFYVLLYPAFADQLGDFELPEGYSAFIGDITDLSRPRAYFQAEFFSFMMPLLVVVFVVTASTALLAGEENHGTLELMLAQPLRRRDFFLQRVAGLVVATLLICALAGLGFLLSAPFLDLEGDVTVLELAVAPFAAAPLALACASLGLLVGALAPRRSAATGIVAAETVVVYLMEVFANLADVLDPMRYLSPFFYADTKRVLLAGVVPWHLAVLLGAFVLLTALAMRAFERREIAAGRWQLRALRGGGV